MGYKIEKLDDPKGQCGLHPSQKWAVIDDVWGLKDAFRTFGEAEAYVIELQKEEARAKAKEAVEAASRFKGTPGPWFQCDHALWGCATTGPDGTGHIVATVNIGRGDTKSIMATAKLIAAAPDLLAAVQGALSVGYDENGWQTKARAALKKAGIEE